MTEQKQETKDLFAGVNEVPHPASATDLERKHLPVITAPKEVKAGECFEVTVEVGQPARHPSENGHFIQFIELYAGDTYLTRIDLTARTTCPAVRTCLALPRDLGPLVAYERCNLHGVWKASSVISVR